MMMGRQKNNARRMVLKLKGLRRLESGRVYKCRLRRKRDISSETTGIIFFWYYLFPV